MKKVISVITLLLLICFWGVNVNAVPCKKVLDRDCTAEKTAKNTAMKATVGVGGPCGPTDVIKDKNKDAVGLDDKKDKKKKDKKKKHFKKKSALIYARYEMLNDSILKGARRICTAVCFVLAVAVFLQLFLAALPLQAAE